MKKTLSTVIAFVMMFTLFLLPQAQAASAIKIYIDGELLATDQAPVAIGGRTFVPMRSIFEALDATVDWIPSTKTISATKGAITVVMKLGATTATINDQKVTLDAPARAMNGRTLVPTRFVSEALGEEVLWDPSSQSVIITTSRSHEVSPVQYVSAGASNQYGDGRDLYVSFTPPSNQSNVSHYRILVTKAGNAPSFDLAKAQLVRSSNYTVVKTNNAGQSISLTSQTRDVDGALLSANQSYRVFVLTVGKDSYALSNSSPTVTLTNSIVNAATNVKITDVNDNGDGRDLSVSFNKASNDSNITGYRVMIVKSKDASKFDLTAANAVTSAYYNAVSKNNNSTLTTVFNSTSRDTSGELIKNGVSYVAYVLSVSDRSVASLNSLSSASAAVTLGISTQAPVITKVADVSNYNNGRDLQVSFNKSSDESRISYYRIFVVREGDYYNFNVTEANKVSSGRYHDVSKNGNNITLTLPSGMRDVKGNSITNGVAYRVFVMGVVNNNASIPNLLSVASPSITLSNSGVGTVSNLYVNDMTDFNTGQDLWVSFTRPADETNINSYRIFVVKAANAGSFSLATANAITNSNNYTTFYKNGGNFSQALTSSARDVNGALITEGVKYRIFVMSVGGGSFSGSNALSAPSAEITLSGSSIAAVTNVVASDVSDYNNGQDLKVSFTRAANETNINHYRAFVVKSANASSFKLANANAITNPSNYTTIPRTGGNIEQVLSSTARDVNGALIKNDEKYRVFVLSVREGNYSGSNALSAASNEITLTNNGTVAAVRNVTTTIVDNKGNASDVQVTFSKSTTESLVREYRVIIVPSSLANTFDVYDAQSAVANGYSQYVSKSDNSVRLAANLKDSQGNDLGRGAGYTYRAFVLAVSNTNGSLDALSAGSSNMFSLAALPTVSAPEVQNVTANQAGASSSISVTFTNSDENGVAHYAVLLVPQPANGLTEAEATDYYKKGNYTQVAKSLRSVDLSSGSVDVNGTPLEYNVTYRVYVLTVADGSKATVNRLSSSAPTVTLFES
ncbi:copper amine oxidase N-terminal domain-containing protein [Paenibacillus spongiae]|uniref:Copper amine oxidase N-terminal domain-containing protein n=1 Tax=Paenibacillus spongiae TaxID=2909671 RepID=A0ABY5SFY7_9BACL|nr:copper amine oxidase N-terminal domain-containing protein [Paenibacillus spongiae]UVI32904.1 copper amine oxidase N-terminal domain-containing protein [Paenibacillus spongiae]